MPSVCVERILQHGAASPSESRSTIHSFRTHSYSSTAESNAIDTHRWPAQESNIYLCRKSVKRSTNVYVSGFKARTAPCEVIRSSSMSCDEQWHKGQFSFATERDARGVWQPCLLHETLLMHWISWPLPVTNHSESMKHTEISGNMMDLIQCEDEHEPMSLLLELLTTGSSCDAIFHIYAIN